MIERHADTPFAGGALVFPGGRIDPGDSHDGWAEHCDGFGSFPAEEAPARIASIREAFEEAGILLARRDDEMLSGDAVAMLQDWRARVEGDDALFLELAREQGLRLALDALCLYARWEPPAGASHRRYHTWFFAAKAPAAQEAREDGNEATEVIWTSPNAALNDCDNGKRKMIYPTRRNVELLGVSDNADAVIDFAARRRIDTIIPEIAEREHGVVLTIPDDMGYPVTEESLETAFRS